MDPGKSASSNQVFKMFRTRTLSRPVLDYANPRSLYLAFVNISGRPFVTSPTSDHSSVLSNPRLSFSTTNSNPSNVSSPPTSFNSTMKVTSESDKPASYNSQKRQSTSVQPSINPLPPAGMPVQSELTICSLTPAAPADATRSKTESYRRPVHSHTLPVPVPIRDGKLSVAVDLGASFSSVASATY